MKLLILGLNYAPGKIGIAVYTAGMAEALVAMGHEVQVVAGQPYYPAWKIMDGHNAFTYSRGVEAGVDVTRVPHYIPREPSGAKRMLHHFSFAVSSFFPMLWCAVTWRPDAVLTIARLALLMFWLTPPGLRPALMIYMQQKPTPGELETSP